MKIHAIEKRLGSIERKRKDPVTIVCHFPSRSDLSAYYLSGGMEKEEPVVSGELKINLHWGGKPPTSDAFKLKWLRQYTRAQIGEFRIEWKESTCERDNVALSTLNRLLEA